MTPSIAEPQITTDRLVLRPFAPDDRQQYASYHSRRDVYRYLYASAPEGLELDSKFDRVLRQKYVTTGDVFRLAIVQRHGGAVIGEALLKLASKNALQGELGYILNPDFSGHGYAAEAAKGMVDFGFRHLGFHRIFARVDAANSRSIGLLKRLGMRQEAHLVQNDRFGGHWGDELIFALLATEWVSSRQMSNGGVVAPSSAK